MNIAHVYLPSEIRNRFVDRLNNPNRILSVADILIEHENAVVSNMYSRELNQASSDSLIKKPTFCYKVTNDVAEFESLDGDYLEPSQLDVIEKYVEHVLVKKFEDTDCVDGYYHITVLASFETNENNEEVTHILCPPILQIKGSKYGD